MASGSKCVSKSIAVSVISANIKKDAAIAVNEYPKCQKLRATENALSISMAG